MTSAFVFEEPVAYGEEVVNQDGLWKKVIGDLFEDFLLFFAPELHEAIDFSKTPDFLQQELFKEILDKKKGTNYADQIVKVHLKDGKEKWILVHIEVEGSADADFSERMFRYFYRIFDKFDREIVAFAVLTGPSTSTSKESLGFTDLMSGKAHFFRGGMKANRSQEASNEMSLFNVPTLHQFTRQTDKHVV